jgi:hypothetical protein
MSRTSRKIYFCLPVWHRRIKQRCRPTTANRENRPKYSYFTKLPVANATDEGYQAYWLYWTSRWTFWRLRQAYGLLGSDAVYYGRALAFQCTLLQYAKYNLPKRGFPSTKPHGVTSQTTVILAGICRYCWELCHYCELWSDAFFEPHLAERNSWQQQGDRWCCLACNLNTHQNPLLSLKRTSI